MALQLKQMGIRDLAMGLIAYQLEQAQKAKPNEMIETWTVDMSTYRQLTADPFSPGTLWEVMGINLGNKTILKSS